MMETPGPGANPSAPADACSGSLELYRAMFQDAPQGIVIQDAEGRVLAANAAAQRILGMTLEQIRAQISAAPSWPAIHEDGSPFPVGTLPARESLRTGKPVENVVVGFQKPGTGRTLWIEAAAVPVFRPGDPRPCQTFTTMTDITERKQTQDSLRASEEKFAKAFHASPDSVNINRLADGVFLAVNEGFTRITGYTAEEVTGRSSLPGDLGVWVHAEDRRRLWDGLDRDGLVQGLEAQFRRKDGTTLTGLQSASLIEVQGVPCVLTITRDITERARIEEVLRESNQRLELALTSGSFGIWEQNLVDGTQIWSDRLYEIYGMEPGDSRTDYDYWCGHIVHPDDVQAAQAAILAGFKGPQPYDLAFRIIRPDGEVRHIKSDGRVLYDAEGRPVRVIGINRDQTREVQAELERRRLQAELLHAEKLESIGSLAGGVAHDMNNVLAAILGMASTLELDSVDAEARALALDIITRACTRGRDMVKSLLYFARRDMDTMGPVDLNTIAREMVHLLSHTTLKRLQITTDFQEPLGLIEGDAGALSHALINICVNAVDAMPGGGTLRIRTRVRDAWGVEISIQDSGEGMSQEVIRKATEPFYTTKPVGKGTGLGLAMVYGTVQAHKGTFEIRSELGKGTEVILGFPGFDQPEDAAPDAVSAAPAPGGPLRILLVDDDELIRLSVAPMLTALGHAVRTAESGQAALDLLQAGLTVDLVILDMNMPGLNGAQTLAKLLELRPGQQVLMATGYSDDSLAPLLKDHPSVHSLRKPFSMAEVRTRLESLFR